MVSGFRSWVARMFTPRSVEEDSSGEDTVHPVDLEPGDTVGEYVILQKLGEGGFGAVYEAAHPVIGKRAAVKVLHAHHSSDEAVTSRFVAEARAVNQIRHKNIVDIFSFGDLPDGRHYYVMELLEGVPLDIYLGRAGHLPIEECLLILHPLAKALGAAHEAGIAHRDLKPENVFLEIDDEGNVEPKVLDFGLAKLLGPGTVTVHKTRSGTPMGSPRYMSPEQCRGVPVDHRTDVYAFGCMAYHMLTGVPPFDAPTALDVMMAHVSRPPAPPSQCADVNGAFDEPILKMLEKQPENRPQSMLDAYASLVAAAAHAGLATGNTKQPVSTLLRETVRERERTLPRVLELPKPRNAPPAVPSKASAAPSPKALRVLVAVLGLSAGWYIVWHNARPSIKAPVRSAVPSQASTLPQPETARTATTSDLPPRQNTVAITIQCQPTHAELYWNDRLLGTAPGPIHLPRSDNETSLVVKATGYVPLTVPVKPSTDLSIKVNLVPRSPRPSKNDVSRDLENPY